MALTAALALAACRSATPVPAPVSSTSAAAASPAASAASASRDTAAAATPPAAAGSTVTVGLGGPGETSVAHAAWTRTANIYEVNLRQYTPQGTLAAFERHLPRLRAMGVDILWLMPVQPIGVKNRKGPLGSYYSISNYTAVNPELGTVADFKAVVDSAHALGMHVILDWVPNHSSFDHAWITAHPDWYVHKADGSISNARDNEGHDTDWTDVAELNYDNAGLRQAMLGEMQWWLTNTGIDGFRCDVAGGVPDDFWRDTRAALARTRPDIFMLAEAEAPTMHAAFDMTYGWELHHLLNWIAQGKASTDSLDAYLARQARDYPPSAYRMYFTSNHDENSWNGSEFERMGANHVPSFVLAATLSGGMPLVYSGQEASLKKRLRFFEKDTINWRGESLAPFYKAMLELKHTQPALANGAEGGAQARLATTGGSTGRTYAFTRTLGANTVLVAVNFGDGSAHLLYEGLATPGAYTDWLSKHRETLGAMGAVDVPAHGYRVLVK